MWNEVCEKDFKLRFSMEMWENFHRCTLSQECVDIMKEFGDYERNEGIDIEELHKQGIVCLKEWCK